MWARYFGSAAFGEKVDWTRTLQDCSRDSLSHGVAGRTSGSSRSPVNGFSGTAAFRARAFGRATEQVDRANTTKCVIGVSFSKGCLLRQSGQHPCPAADSFVKALKVVLFVGTMDPVIVARETDKHGLHAEDFLEISGDWYGAA